ncbi:hypothetical protein [Prochlorococcus sp. MIT 1300]|uniref:hypothetical protein n=1 Tax=Prochlorococcus sp. MIT 1300 TaxID=3096218 RepID=UPI002A75673C|nr:hypothetical protein [Prochlorococcus sp. MIT 1300]
MLIYVCLSSHGYGHAARQAAVLSELAHQEPTWKFVVSSVVDFRFLKVAFSQIDVVYRHFCWDIGIIQKDALELDLESTLITLNDLETNLPQKIIKELEWVRSYNSPVVVVSDIPASAIYLAEPLNAPLLLLGNFGWDDIYEPLGGEFVKHADLARSKYRKANFVFRCPFSLDMDWGLDELEIGLTSQLPRPLPKSFETTLVNSRSPKVLVGFGGLGINIDPKLFQRWPDHLFILAKPKCLELTRPTYVPNNVVHLPPDSSVVDALPFCSRLLGKPGYSSFCEALSQNVGLHVVSREGFSEAKVLIDQLKLYGKFRLLDQKSFQTGEWELDMPLCSPSYGSLLNNGALSAATMIRTIAHSIA